ncbi:hypothetical protein VNO78_02114 [Psophocarpus tetragonolobus]|uniref:Transcription factor CBF/NF-Y/archaeal histone domain-containing protein n=1 Tax=Psophocarpus tetragonolobus TaxID=3891 RepID=A0AAN9T152_PSOTE
MEDENHSNLPNGLISGSPESPCLKTCSNTSPTTLNNNNNHTNNNNNKEQDRFLPIANVGRIMKKAIPGNGKISKDAKETVQECVSEFISFVTGEASDKCQREKRKTINGDDIIWAITTLGFEDYVDPLKSYLQKYKELEGEKLNIPKQQRSDQQRLHQQQHPHQDQNNNLPLSSVYSSPNLISQPPYVATDQLFSLPFSPNSIQKQLQQQDQIDSVGQCWVSVWLGPGLFTTAGAGMCCCVPTLLGPGLRVFCPLLCSYSDDLYCGTVGLAGTSLCRCIGQHHFICYNSTAEELFKSLSCICNVYSVFLLMFYVMELVLLFLLVSAGFCSRSSWVSVAGFCWGICSIRLLHISGIGVLVLADLLL